jgi:hypothetical protein
MKAKQRVHGETAAHAGLKRLALAWAQAGGFAHAGLEVRVPRSGYRADVAASGPDEAARTAIFECKQARADLLKDAHAEAATRARMAELADRRRRLEEMLALHRPDLRRGEALWPEYDAWDFSSLGHRTHRRVLRELAAVRNRISHGTKFSRLQRYRCADHLYLVVREDIYAEAEIPPGWGLLVHAGGRLQLERQPVDLDPAPDQRAALFAAIARTGAREPTRGRTPDQPDVRGRSVGYEPGGNGADLLLQSEGASPV